MGESPSPLLLRFMDSLGAGFREPGPCYIPPEKTGSPSGHTDNRRKQMI